MSIKKTDPTKHGIERIKERLDIPTKQIKQLVIHARRNGKTINDFNNFPEFQDFLRKKAYRSHKKIKVYLGYIWVFCTTSTKLITVYKIPEEFQTIKI